MKAIKIIMTLAAMLLLNAGNSLNAQNMKEESVPRNLSAFPVEDANIAYAKYFSGRSFIAPLATDKALNCPINNVTFEPGCRNNWHSHTDGQILIAVGGMGYYQEKGKPAQLLKRGALGARTIDEGAMDEKNGMNFSEYMAILSGNTDLLEKAKLEKRIAALESERKAHNKGISDSKFRYQTITYDIANNEAAIERMKADAARYAAVVKRDKDGNPLNNLTIDTCNPTDEKNMGIHLQGLAQRTDTHGQYQRIGEVYGFPISIISERVLTDGHETVLNRFVVEGNYKLPLPTFIGQQ